MTWQEELKKESVFGNALLSRKVVKVEFAETFITSLLKKQRDNILNQFTDMEGTIDIPLVISLIKSAPDE